MVSKTLRSLLSRADRLKADQQQVNFITMQSKKSNRLLLYRIDKANSFTICSFKSNSLPTTQNTKIINGKLFLKYPYKNSSSISAVDAVMWKRSTRWKTVKNEIEKKPQHRIHRFN
ncbi:hypothetical protein Tsp_08437 [Trichinella spiralis]|uniref:hypothetical protein n=1 Tax=Trichinella spiralis TaxID=6334 RepID=UPI0001EFB772|nr:hypothetical protein Tsp_08437 [Trichinella spiralis]